MEVGDHDLGALNVLEQIVGHQLAMRVIVVRVVGLKHSQAVLDGEPRRHHQKAPRKDLAVGTPGSVECLPGNQHRHHRRLAGPGCEL